jgi:LmbE family N-acetylglucosaminyl deacetylase
MADEPDETSLAGRVVFLAPHLDDAALSLGAALARAARGGAEVRVLTVFAGDPDADRAPDPWDAACGFRTAGEAARGRRAEDRRACAILGAQPVWLPFDIHQHARPGEDERIADAVARELRGAELLLLPGFPLVNVDHAWVAEFVLPRLAGTARIALWAELPYAYLGDTRPDGTQAVPPGRDPRWVTPAAGLRDRFAKGRACRAYWSQFRGRASVRYWWARERPRALHLDRRFMRPELHWVPERLAWL